METCFAQYRVMFGQTAVNHRGEILIFHQGDSTSTEKLNSATSRRRTSSSRLTPGKPGSHSIASVNCVQKKKTEDEEEEKNVVGAGGEIKKMRRQLKRMRSFGGFLELEKR